MNELQEMEQIYCLEIPKGIEVVIDYSNRKLSIARKERGQLGFYIEDIGVMFDKESLTEKLSSFNQPKILLYGKIHGPDLTFSCFDVKLNNDWLEVPMAKALVNFLGFQFVSYATVTPKETEFQKGIILRPIRECVTESGKRLIQEIK